jgi:hypothetical protein
MFMKNTVFFFFTLWLVACTSKNEVVNELSLPKKGYKFQLVQRTQALIPSTDGNVTCSINDITKGQTEIVIKENENVLLAESIMEMEPINFKLNGHSYTITCTFMMNKLIGQDYAQFELVENIHPDQQVKDETKEIETLLKKIESSNVIFIRNGNQYTAEEAADHLRSKLEHANGKIKTRKDFIDQLATKSSLTGEFYLVQLKDGSKIKAADWLNKL